MQEQADRHVSNLTQDACRRRLSGVLARIRAGLAASVTRQVVHTGGVRIERNTGTYDLSRRTPCADNEQAGARGPGDGRGPGALVAAAAASALLSAAAGADAADSAWQSPARIQSVAEDYLRMRTGGTAANTTVRAASLDARHRLPRCERSLEAFLRRGAKIGPRTIVGVRCAGSKPWKVYVPVDVIVTAPVLTAGRMLPRGHLVTAEDLGTDTRDVSRMTAGYYSDPRDLEGLRVKHQIPAGRVLTPAMLEADRVIRRGQSVTLIAGGGGLRIEMAGKALMDGARNQRIRVENSSSGRVVEGIVRSAEHVEVIVSRTHAEADTHAKVSPATADTRLSNNDR